MHNFNEEFYDEDHFTHSSEAFSIYNEFTENDITILVEGKDDVIFWRIILNNIVSVKFDIEPLGGKNEVGKRISDLIDGRLKNTILAVDNDHSAFGNKEHKNIIYTKGYSIENTLVKPSCVSEIITSYSDIDSNKAYEDCKYWFDKMYESLERLIMLDIIGATKKGVKIIGSHYSCLVSNERSCINICPKKKSEKLNIMNDISDEEVEATLNKIKNSNKNIGDYLRGHFLISIANHFAVNYLNSLKSKGDKKINISEQNFFSSLIILFKNKFGEDYPEYGFYKAQICRAIA